MEKRPLRPAQQPRSEPETEVHYRPSEATPVPVDDDETWRALGSTQVTSNLSSVDAVLNARNSSAGPDGGKATGVRSELGDFRLLKKLGEGAMGAVYKAKQLSFNRVVALKILFRHIADNEKLVQRLHREGQAMGLLSHPNLVAGYCVDEVDGWHYVAMEYVRGKSLQFWVDRLGRLSVGDAVAIISACAHGLHHAHELGLVHRDIKPENVLVSDKGEIKITDMGMVKMVDEDMSLTQTGFAVGTPWYMPLEQAKNAKEADRRVDIYALGCTLYCLLTGRPPFAGGTIVDVIAAKERGTFAPARQVNQEVPERLDLVIAKMTAKDPKYRYQTCEELLADLDRLKLANDSLTFLSVQADSPPNPESSINLAMSLTAEAAAVELPADEWYLRFRLPDGKVAVRKVSTSQVAQLIQSGKLEASAKISRRKDEGYRALATYKEFEQAALARVSRKAADQKTVRYRSLYKEIEEKDQQNQTTESAGNAQLAYIAPLLLKGAAAMLCVGFLGLIVWMLGRVIN